MSPDRSPTDRMLLVPLLGLMIFLALCSGSALAAETGVVKFFGGNGTEGGKFPGTQSVQGIAVNQTGAGGASPGDIYVSSPFNRRIEEFTASGEFVRAFGLGVGGPGVNVCSVASACVAGEASAQAGSLVSQRTIAVDQATGTVYVIDNDFSPPSILTPSNNRVDVFSATGEFEGAFGWNVKVSGGAEELQFCTTESGCKAGSEGTGVGQLSRLDGGNKSSIAVSPLNGHVILNDVTNARSEEFAPNIEAGKVTGVSFVRSYAGYASGVTVDQSGEIYLLNNGGVDSYSPTGNPEGTLLEFAELGEGRDITIDSLNGNILVNRSTDVREYAHSGELLATYLNGVSNGVFIFGVAVNEQTETIYLTTDKPEAGVLVLGEPVPPTASIEAVTTFTGTTVTFEGHVNPQGFLTGYHFEYSADGVKWTALPAKQLPSDSEEHAVSQQATGLVGHTHYQVRLVAEKLFNGGKASAETTFDTAASAPVISTVGVEEITDTTAKLVAKLNPENEETSYHFECVSQAQFEASGYAEAKEAPSGGASLKASGETVEVSAQLSGLSPTTAYRCRLTASNPTGPVTGSEASFTTFASQPLGPPDGRVYEQVTPVGKNGGDARGDEFKLRAAPDGEAASYLITGGGATEGGGGQHLGVYSALRGGDSWDSHNLWPAVSFGNFATIVGWSEDLHRDYVVSWHSGEPKTLYEQDLESGAMTAIGAIDANAERVRLVAESADGSKTIFESEEALATGATAGWSNVYLWNRTTHKLSVVDLLSNGTQPFHGAFAGPFDWVNNDPKHGGASAGAGSYYTQQLHALSENGSTLFFTSYNVNQLYARTGLDTASPKTVQVSASQKTNGPGGGKDPKGPQKAAFMEATPDGRYVFFTSSEELTNDATTGSADQGNDLYRYDTQTGELIDIAPDTTDANGAQVRGVIGSSADGSSVYFDANGVLAAGASPGNCSQFGGSCSIYLWHEGQISFVAPTGGSLEHGDLNWLPTNTNGCCFLNMKAGRVSADGTLLFLSELSPTSYDSEGKREFYRYEPGVGLECVSCNPIGAPPVGGATMQSIKAGYVKVSQANPIWVRNLSANGKRVFFETPDQLVATDSNGARGCPIVPNSQGVYRCQDVYEWEAKGEGNCESENQNGGCIYLISTGESNEPSYFADASENGNDVFFFTRQQLVRQDTDQLQDLYDARVGGGIASQNEAPPPRCEGEACKGPAPAASGTESAGSASFSGPGNPKPNRHKHKKKRHAKKHHKGRAKHASKGRAGR